MECIFLVCFSYTHDLPESKHPKKKILPGFLMAKKVAAWVRSNLLAHL